MTITKKTKQFLAALRGTRQRRDSSAQETYFNAATLLASGREPKDRAALLDAMAQLGRTEEDLGRDAELIASHAAAEQQAQRRDAARKRLDDAAEQQRQADARARDLERQARDVRAAAAAAVAEARTEADAATKSGARATQLRLELSRRGHPRFAGLLKQEQVQREVERRQNDLRAVERELAEAEAAAATFDGVQGGGVETAVTAGARRARQEVLRLRDIRDRMAREIAELRGEAIDEGEDVSDQLLAEEVQQ